MRVSGTSDWRLYISERKEEILKIIKDNNFPLVWEDGVDGGVVFPHFDFALLDEKVLALEPIPEAELVPVGGIHAAEQPLDVPTGKDIWKYALDTKDCHSIERGNSLPEMADIKEVTKKNG
jgi:hypothetical protein